MPDRGGASHPLVELTMARLREFLREPEAVFWVFAFPIIMTCALGIAFRSRGGEAVIVGVVDAPGREAIVSALEEVGRFTIRVIDPADVERAIRDGRALSWWCPARRRSIASTRHGRRAR